MKWRLIYRLSVLLIVLVGLGACVEKGGAVVQANDVAPPLTVTALDGAVSEVRAAPGRTLWLSFWATWCTPCQAEWPDLNQAQRELAGAGVELVAISVNEPADAVEQFLQEQPADFRVVRDPEGQAAARYGVIGFPTHVLIDSTGVVRAIVRGPLDGRRAQALIGGA
jgi:thiol-disulfide isomerase/thioredoxin